MCSFWGCGTWKRWRAPRASTCADICLKLSLLSSPAVPHFICLSALGFHTDDEGPRCSAMRCSSNPPFFFFFLTLGKLLTEVWLPWRRSSGWTHQIRCLTAQVHTDKNLLRALFMRHFHHSSWLWIWQRAEFSQVLVPFVYWNIKKASVT